MYPSLWSLLSAMCTPCSCPASGATGAGLVLISPLLCVMGKHNCNLLPLVCSAEHKDDSALLHSIFTSERARTHPSPGGPRNHGYQRFTLGGFYLLPSALLFILHPSTMVAGRWRCFPQQHTRSPYLPLDLYGVTIVVLHFEALSKYSTSL